VTVTPTRSAGLGRSTCPVTMAPSRAPQNFDRGHIAYVAVATVLLEPRFVTIALPLT
jgi:hypothetical protein